MLTQDGLTAYVSSESNRLAHVGSHDIYRVTRASTSDAFGNFVNESEINSTGGERASWISPDNCRLYFESDKDFGITEIYLATKTPK